MLFLFATKKKSAHEFTGKNMFRNGLRVRRGPKKRELERNAYLLLEGFNWPAFMRVRNEFLGKTNFDHPKVHKAGGWVGAVGLFFPKSDEFKLKKRTCLFCETTKSARVRGSRGRAVDIHKIKQ